MTTESVSGPSHTLPARVTSSGEDSGESPQVGAEPKPKKTAKSKGKKPDEKKRKKPSKKSKDDDDDDIEDDHVPLGNPKDGDDDEDDEGDLAGLDELLRLSGGKAMKRPAARKAHPKKPSASKSSRGKKKGPACFGDLTLGLFLK